LTRPRVGDFGWPPGGIGYVLERHAEEKATVVLPRDSVREAAQLLASIDGAREQLAALARNARLAAAYHSSDNWYKRRAEWTVDAFSRHVHAGATG